MTFGPHQDLLLLALLIAIAALLVLAPILRTPYPILLVLGGLALGFVPGIQTISLPPDIVLVAILPPLLYSAAFYTSLRDLRQNVIPISALAIGLVVATTVGVAAVAHTFIPHVGWGPAFVLGAVVSPTDPLAATAIARRLGVPRRIVAIVEGESLVNDGTALVLYRVAVVAVVSGSFSIWNAGLRFVWTAAGGIAVGQVTIAILSGYFAYLPAAALGVSGVLAVVTVGVYMGWRTPELTSVQTRLDGAALWQILTFVVNALLFGLVGLQLHHILNALSSRTAAELVGDAALVGGAVILIRIVWIFPLSYVPWRLWGRSDRREAAPPWQRPAVVSWMGLRGAVTLAAALAVPLTTDSGEPFPDRPLIIYLAFAAIVATLVFQGLTLPFAIRALGVEADDLGEREESKARIHAADAALARLEELADEDWVRPDTAERLRRQMDFRRSRFAARFSEEDDGAIEEQSQAYQRLLRELLNAERAAVVALRREGRINDDVMQRVTRDLDLEDARLDAQ
ncbi:MAG: Na+/H+ antiporter [Actinobacteria bacterium]|nr:MAG: Na+/H+ antiporter [Actinomycetota bacterium]